MDSYKYKSSLNFHYPTGAVCMICDAELSIWEEVDIGMGEMELWCYCPYCDIDTFHPRKKLNEEVS